MNKKRLTVWIIIGLMVVIGCIKFFSVAKPQMIDPQQARSKGSPEARVKIVEFIDFQCPACANGVKILHNYFGKHPNDIYLQVRYFPLPTIHRHAITSALYSECAARQGKFWPLNDLMMPQQSQWEQLLSAEPVFQSMAMQVGVNGQKFNECLSSASARQAINDDKSLGQSLGINSTPTYFINNKMVVGTKSLVDELKTYFPDN